MIKQRIRKWDIFISHASKEWAQKELDALFAKETGKRKIIIPIWLNITKFEVLKFSPLMADRLALNASIGVTKIVNKILPQVTIEKATNSSLDTKINRYRTIERNEFRFIASEIILRFHQIFGCLSCLATYISEMGFFNKKSSNNRFIEFDKKFARFSLQMRKKFEIPNGVWGIGFDEALNREGLKDDSNFISQIESLVTKWVEGKMSMNECQTLYWLIEEEIDSDLGYIIFGIPNRELKPFDFDKVNQEFFEFGVRNKKHRSTNA